MRRPTRNLRATQPGPAIRPRALRWETVGAPEARRPRTRRTPQAAWLRAARTSGNGSRLLLRAEGARLMPVQKTQGKRRPLVPRVDELPAGVPAPPRPAPQRDASGRFQVGSGTTELARAGGHAAADARQLGQLLGLWEVP